MTEIEEVYYRERMIEGMVESNRLTYQCKTRVERMHEVLNFQKGFLMVFCLNFRAFRDFCVTKT